MGIPLGIDYQYHALTSRVFWHNFSYFRSVNIFVMKSASSALLIVVVLIATACSSGPFGKKVKEPFRGNAYESNNRFFRSTGKGESSQDNIALGKANSEAKSQLASQMNTTMKQVTDQYLGQTENERAADVADKFQSLVREVMNTDLADMRKIGQEKYFNEKTKVYTVFVAYEIKKNAMFRFMKKQAKTNQKIDERQQEIIQKILDQELEKAGDDDSDK
jgi:hypothetical protein